MFRSTLLSLSLAAITTAGLAQSTTPQAAPAAASPEYMQSQPAPIERTTPQQATQQAPDSNNQPQQRWGQRPPQPRWPHGEMRVLTSQPAQGIWVRSARHAQLDTVAATNDHVELRINSGLVNITVHHPVSHQLILVDFAGGQVALIKDGLYTFNTQTKTARVLVGEAKAYPTPTADVKPVKIKENHALTFGQPTLRTVSFGPMAGNPDLLPNRNAASYGDGYGSGYGDGSYSYYGAPYAYYGYGDPYFWGPGWGWGYPFGFGLGFGYFGGFGGYYGGFHGRR